MDEVRYVIGIDPGITGALALVRSHGQLVELLDVADMPTATVKTNRISKSHIIAPQLTSLLSQWRVSTETTPDVVLEDVHAMPGQGVTSMFRFGHALGLVEGVVSGLGLPLHKVPPREWQTMVRVRSDPDAGRLRASQLFPTRAGLFTRKKDHNRADAALIAYAGTRLVVT